MSYNPRKAAHMIAAFIRLNGGKPIPVLKIIKLVYLADRESIKRSALPILDEPRYSFPKGPVNGYTHNFIKKLIDGRNSPEKGWEVWPFFLKASKGKKEIGLARQDISEDDLDELSPANEGCIKSVWEAHGGKSAEELVEWTHNPANIPEWENPEYGKIPIEFRDIVYALKLPEAEAIIEQYDELLAIDNSFKRLGIHYS